MKRILLLLPLLATGTASLAFAPAPFPRPDRRDGSLDLRKLEGTWKVEQLVNFDAQGKVSSTITVWKEIHVEKGQWYFVQDGGGGRMRRSTTYRLVIDGKKKPATIDFMRAGNPKPWMLGILALENDRLTVLYKPFGEKRPEAFTPPPAGFYQFTLRRAR